MTTLATPATARTSRLGMPASFALWGFAGLMVAGAFMTLASIGLLLAVVAAVAGYALVPRGLPAADAPVTKSAVGRFLVEAVIGLVAAFTLGMIYMLVLFRLGPWADPPGTEAVTIVLALGAVAVAWSRARRSLVP